VLADVRRGIWQPPKPEPVVVVAREVPTFHQFASEWFERQKVEAGRRGGGLTDAGTADLRWRLSSHLLPFFKSMPLDTITVQDVDRYRLAKVKDGRLNATSINKSLATLCAILETAVEYEWIARNPAHGRRRRLPSVTPTRSSLDRAEHITALLDGAGELDAHAISRHGQRRALLATLVFAGLRIGEALALRWGDVDLARGTIKVRASKTDAGVRTVNVVAVLRDELDAYRARSSGHPSALVFGTSTGNAQHRSHVRSRVLAKAVEKANERLLKAETELLPAGLTLHSLRRTFASLLFAIGESPPYVMAQMGHATAELTLGIYARQMNRRDGEPERLKALVEGAEMAAIGSHNDQPAENDAVHADTDGQN
jgi:integrase